LRADEETPSCLLYGVHCSLLGDRPFSFMAEVGPSFAFSFLHGHRFDQEVACVFWNHLRVNDRGNAMLVLVCGEDDA
jgi:hypothetical protein